MISILAAALTLAAPAQAAPAAAPDYRNPDNWLCRPGRDGDACTQDLDTTVIAASGKRSIEKFVPAADPKFDCFYVYPTVSLDPTPNSDLNPGPEELRVVQFQAQRFRAQCRVFAPIYRQVTLTALRSLMVGGTPAIDRAMAYGDVKAAWDDYLAHDNHGRGVVLIGHSQGSLVLTQLIAREIDGKPVQKQIVSAMLLGTNIGVPEGKDVGGTFKAMPLCRKDGQSGCVVTWASFRAESPPLANSRFGKVPEPGMVAGCTNPAALASGGPTPAHAYLGARGASLTSPAQTRWTGDDTPVDTPFVSVPGLLSTQCVSAGGFSYLAVTTHGDPADPRTDHITGDVQVGDVVLRDWGLHLIDVNVMQGDLVALAGKQAAAWAKRR